MWTENTRTLLFLVKVKLATVVEGDLKAPLFSSYDTEV